MRNAGTRVRSRIASRALCLALGLGSRQLNGDQVLPQSARRSRLQDQSPTALISEAETDRRSGRSEGAESCYSQVLTTHGFFWQDQDTHPWRTFLREPHDDIRPN
jgi:hypothetical protein